jgi:NTE family protein
MADIPADKVQRKPVMLALQGGGAHGAFTWGVLDAFLEDGRLDVKAISGTSAGAMNAVVYAAGLLDGGASAARAQLERFWRSASRDGQRDTAMFRNPFLEMRSGFGERVGQNLLDAMPALATPYRFNPLNINPLEDFLEKEIRFEHLHAASPCKLFIAATNVVTGKIRVFRETELTAQMVVASACLPNLFQAVTIDGVPYWDGGYTGNPALFPLFTIKEVDDILLVQINPLTRDATPRTASDIQDRVSEISFNAPLIGELRAIGFVARLIEQERLPAHYKRVLMHRISLHDTVKNLDAASKGKTDWGFLMSLKKEGRKAAKAWLKAHFDDLGVRATLDLTAAISS